MSISKRIFLGLSGAAALLALTLSGCTLYSDVDISPLRLLPGDTFSPLQSIPAMNDAGDFARAISLASMLQERRTLNGKELGALGEAELAAGRLDAARRHLRAALDLRPFRTEASILEWNLSQTEYMANNYAAALEWATAAREDGLTIREWHMSYLQALSNVDTYRVEGATSVTTRMDHERPNLPRIRVRINDGDSKSAVVDSGAAISIISTTMAKSANVRSLGDFRGMFYGLLGEPIEVQFGLLDSLRIDDMVIRDVPVAIMPEGKMKFFVNNRQPYNIDVLLGTNLLKDFYVEFNFRANSLLLRRLRPADRVPAADQNLFLIGSRPMVHSTINQKGWYLFVVDSGSEITFLNDAEILKTRLREIPKIYGALLQGLGGSMKRGTKFENISVGVDKWSGMFRHIPLYNAENTAAFGIIGENYLQNFRVVMDFGTMKFTLERERRF